MALQKSITLKNGATGNYLKINTLVLDKSLMKMTVALGLYADSTYAKPTFIAGTPATEETDSTPAVPAVPDKIIAPLALAQTFKTFSFNSFALFFPLRNPYNLQQKEVMIEIISLIKSFSSS